MDKSTANILWFDQVNIGDIPLVGGKNASLGEMYQALTPKGVNVPNGFCVTAHAYQKFMEESGMQDKIREILDGLDTNNVEDLQRRGHQIRTLIRSAQLPEYLVAEIAQGYYNMCKQYGNNCDVAVRSSATAEDLPDASFAGQQETYLNIREVPELIEACKKCFASLFTNRAISYRKDKGFDQMKVYLSIGVQKMVRSDLACSGVMFTIDTESGFKDAVFLTGAYGLGETVVKGAVNPDEYYIFKPTLNQGKQPILSKKVGQKAIKMVYSVDSNEPTKTVDVSHDERIRYVLNNDEILQLARWGVQIEEHYSQKHQNFCPMDIEWAKDGETGELFIVQARPETVQSQKDETKLKEYVLKEQGKVLTIGASVGSKIGQGKAALIRDSKEMSRFNKGDVLVTDMTDPDWEPIMKIASAIVTNRGGRTCHAAIVSRELGIPCVVGTNDCTSMIQDGGEITVDCSSGESGKVFEGLLKFEIKETDLKNIPDTKTDIMVNVGNPEQAFESARLPNKGVGLAREEFIINSYIKIHPMALINYDNLKDQEAKHVIGEMTAAYEDKKEFFIERLAHGVAMIAAGFYPKPVIVRMSDFKSNEYANLIGGNEFEPTEDNPMIGWRGASRYYSNGYKQGFALECEAMRRVRDDMGLTNVVLMIPMCRTIDEGKKVLETMKEYGLERGKNDLQVYVMCEVPSNVMLADQFSEIFDGFSIGSNDLTQLTLGLDRDSELVADIFDERNDAVKAMAKKVIKTANKLGKKIGICGDAPSTYPEFAKFLVDCGINSISLSPDAVIKTTLLIAEHENSK